MADIDLKELFQQKQREFNTEGSGITRVESDFVSAVNYATSRISRQADLATRIAKVTKPEGDVDLSDEYEDVLADLVSLRMIQFGHRLRDKDFDTREMRETMDERIDMVRQDVLDQAQEDDDDNESDYVGLGASTGGVSTGGANA